MKVLKRLRDDLNVHLDKKFSKGDIVSFWHRDSGHVRGKVIKVNRTTLIVQGPTETYKVPRETVMPW